MVDLCSFQSYFLCCLQKNLKLSSVPFCCVQVHRVFAKGAASLEGTIQSGDAILSINGASLEGRTHVEAVSCLHQTRFSKQAVVVISRSEDSELKIQSTPRTWVLQKISVEARAWSSSVDLRFWSFVSSLLMWSSPVWRMRRRKRERIMEKIKNYDWIHQCRQAALMDRAGTGWMLLLELCRTFNMSCSFLS